MSIRGLLVAAVVAAAVPLVDATALAGEADVVGVEMRPQGPGLWRFDVAVRHDDAGWDHYADKWDVVGPDGAVLGTRVLMHPHETEQPFTRSLTGVAVPDGVAEVTVRAHDKVHGYGGRKMTVTVPR